MREIVRVYRKGDLEYLSPDGSPCENCGGVVRDHEWADMDPLAFIVNCSVEPKP